MRLIDADEFKKQIARMSIVNNYPADKVNKMCELIDCQATAYDVDKVIEEIDEIISLYELCVQTQIKEVDGKFENKMTFEICSLHNNRGYLEGLKRALEIVKSGGVAAE